jgi:hypothetical protein
VFGEQHHQLKFRTRALWDVRETFLALQHKVLAVVLCELRNHPAMATPTDLTDTDRSHPFLRKLVLTTGIDASLQ